MNEEKLKYWKSRMQDTLHRIDKDVTKNQQEILGMAQHCGLDLTELIKAFRETRAGMLLVATAIEQGKIKTAEKVIKEAVESGKITKEPIGIEQP